jgi:hypothetical protein
MNRRRLIAAALGLAIVAGCGTRTDAPKAISVSYKLLLNDGEVEHEYMTGKPKRVIVDAFIQRNDPGTPAKDSAYVVVELIPEHGPETALYQRPSDLSLSGVQLEAFVNYYDKGEMSYLPDHADVVPVETIIRTLEALCADLGAKGPHVTVVSGSYLINNRWYRKMQNQVPEDTARKLADPQD